MHERIIWRYVVGKSAVQCALAQDFGLRCMDTLLHRRKKMGRQRRGRSQ